jgi:hypothetical protein
MQMSKWLNMLTLTGFAVVFETEPAYAYLDPGTASLVLQGIIGAVGAGIVAAGVYWRKFTALFRRSEPKQAEGTSSNHSLGGADDRHAD